MMLAHRPVATCAQSEAIESVCTAGEAVMPISAKTRSTMRGPRIVFVEQTKRELRSGRPCHLAAPGSGTKRSGANRT